jgi:hypothetical protein
VDRDLDAIQTATMVIYLPQINGFFSCSVLFFGFDGVRLEYIEFTVITTDV